MRKPSQKKRPRGVSSGTPRYQLALPAAARRKDVWFFGVMAAWIVVAVALHAGLFWGASEVAASRRAEAEKAKAEEKDEFVEVIELPPPEPPKPEPKPPEPEPIPEPEPPPPEPEPEPIPEPEPPPPEPEPEPPPPEPEPPPPPEPPKPEPPKPKPKPEPAKPKPKAPEPPPPPKTTEPEPPPEPDTSKFVDLGAGIDIGATGVGGTFAVSTGNSASGNLGGGGTRDTRGKPGGTAKTPKGSPDGAKDGTGDAPSTPAPVSRANLTKKAAQDKAHNLRVQAKYKGQYPKEKKLAGEEADVKAMLVVDAQGKVVKVEIISPANPGFDEIATKAFQELRFSPALDADGKAVASSVGPMTWRFRLQDT